MLRASRRPLSICTPPLRAQMATKRAPVAISNCFAIGALKDSLAAAKGGTACPL
jgi:hypothetical protein